MQNDNSNMYYRYRFGNAVLDEARHELIVNGEVVACERLPMEVLRTLLRLPDQLVTKEQLLTTVWEGTVVSDGALTNTISKLRKSLVYLVDAQIVTVAGKGYRLAGKVERLAHGQRTGSEAASPFEVGDPVPGREEFVLQAILGGGVHGDVWLAEHRKLPVKRVFKFAVEPERLKALYREYAVYRVLHERLGERSDLARIVGTNLFTPPFYLECEFAGSSWLAWAQAGHLATMPRSERLALFLRVAQTLADAHGAGVLHKDIKPANLLIDRQDAQWVVRITDFGSSRLMDPSILKALSVTETALDSGTQNISTDSLRGTLLYLAPELLAGGEPSVQTDLYALGQVLYQLLVGDFSRPPAPGWEAEIGDDLLSDDIRAAMHTDAAQRLPDVPALIARLKALDARRAQQDRDKDLALRVAQAERALAKTRAQRPWIMAALATLVVGIGVSLTFYVRERSALEQARLEATRARAINDFLNLDVLQSLDPVYASAKVPPHLSELVVDAGAKAPARFKDQPLTEASVHEMLGGVLGSMGKSDASAKAYRQALALLEKNVSANDPRLATVQLKLARNLFQRGQVDEAKKLLNGVEQAVGATRLSDGSELAYLADRTRHIALAFEQKYVEAIPVCERLVAWTRQYRAERLRERFSALRDLASMQFQGNRGEAAMATMDEALAPPFSPATVGKLTYAIGELGPVNTNCEAHRRPARS